MPDGNVAEKLCTPAKLAVVDEASNIKDPVEAWFALVKVPA